MKTTKIVFFTFLFFLLRAPLFSQDGGADQLERSELLNNLGPVEFIDNPAAPTRIDTRAQILSIGSALGRAAAAGSAEAGLRGRYFIIHRLYDQEFDKLDADIFGLGTLAEVDQIQNLRLIIQGYLQSAYNYSTADAALLAEYITIYNAVYRKNRVYFAQRYKTPLLNDVTPGSEGLSVRWDEWPGATFMLVPLQTAIAGSLSAIDTTSITEDPVIRELRKDDDRGIEDRKQMVDLKEREAEEAEKKAAAARAEIAEKEKQLAQEKQQIAEKKQQIEEERAKIADSDDSETDKQERGEELDKEEAALADREENVADSEAELEKQREDAQASEALAERKTEEASRERESISADQREIIAAAPAANAAKTPEGVIGIKLAANNSFSGSPVKVDPASGTQLKTSPLNFVRARTLTVAGGKTIVIAGENGENGAYRLLQIDGNTLQTAKLGTDEINKESLIWSNGNNLYAIIIRDKTNYLGRFNTDLVLQAASTQPVHPFASVVLQGDRILTQNAAGSIISLNAQDLIP